MERRYVKQTKTNLAISMKTCRVICCHRPSPVEANTSKLYGALFRQTKVQNLGSCHKRSHVVNSTLRNASPYRHKSGAFHVGLGTERVIAIQYPQNTLESLRTDSSAQHPKERFIALPIKHKGDENFTFPTGETQSF